MVVVLSSTVRLKDVIKKGKKNPKITRAKPTWQEPGWHMAGLNSKTQFCI